MNEKWYQEELDLMNTCKKCGIVEHKGYYVDKYGWFCQKHLDQLDQLLKLVDDFIKEK